jgi:hypothetical protein
MNQVIPTATPGVFNAGLVKIRNPEAIAAEDAERAAENDNTKESPVISGLSAYLDKLWARARDAKQPIEQQMLKSLRQRHGVYEPDKLAAIKEMGGSQVYMLITLAKCRAAEAWINDIMRPVGDRPWDIKPTPIASIPLIKEQEITRDVTIVRDLAIQPLMQSGLLVNWGALAEELKAYEEEMREKIQLEIQEEAIRRATNMGRKIEDEATEGGWHTALWEVIQDLVTLKAGCLKGPVLKRRKAHVWTQDEAGAWVIEAQDVVVKSYERVSPFDIYPSPDSCGVDDGYMFQRHKLKRSELVEMIGVPGYNEDNIREVLREYDGGKVIHLPIDIEIEQLTKGNTDGITFTDKIEALEFWGACMGKDLIEWGMEEIDPELEYEINAWKIGPYTIRAIINPDKLGRNPYSIDSYERCAGSFWGRGVPELMADIADVCNALARAIVNNASLASGPQTEVDTGRCGDVEKIYPWKIWPSSNKQMAEGPAVRFTQPQIIIGELLNAFQTFVMLADDPTGIPRWSTGNTNLLSGAGGTSSGLSMLMTSASRSIKEVISHIDNIVSSAITRHYDYNMMYETDDNCKGDAKIVARGSSALMAKEQRLVRTSEFLQATLNPVDLQIIGIEGRAKLLREAAHMLELTTADDIFPKGEIELKALVSKLNGQLEGMIASMGKGKSDRENNNTPMDKQRNESGVRSASRQQGEERKLDQSGAPMGGENMNLQPAGGM